PPATRSIARLDVPCRVSDASSTVTVNVVIETLPEVSVVRTKIVFCPSRKVSVADHEVVPVARIQVDPSALTSTFSMATLSDAVPVKVIVVELTTVLFGSEPIAAVGGVESGAAVGVAETSIAGPPLLRSGRSPDNNTRRRSSGPRLRR